MEAAERRPPAFLGRCANSHARGFLVCIARLGSFRRGSFPSFSPMKTWVLVRRRRFGDKAAILSEAMLSLV
jgi:hypothetical protein